MKPLKHLFALSALAVAVVAAPSASASATFNGITFTFLQTDSNTLTLEMAGTPSGNWATANYLAAFDLKDLGLDFTSVTGTANGPGASNLVGNRSQLSGSDLTCPLIVGPGEKGSICFDISPDTPLGTLPIDFLYTIDFSADLNIAAAGPHLQIAFTVVQDGEQKIGDLYSENIPLGSSSGGPPSSGPLPEGNSGVLALIGLGVLGGMMWARRRSIPV